MRTFLLPALVFLISHTFPAMAQEGSEAEHEKLVALRSQFVEALNTEDFELLKGLVTDDMTFTTISNEKLNGIAELEAYWEKMFEGDDSVLLTMTVAPEVDGKTDFISPTVGLAQGTSSDSYKFRGIGSRSMPSRWTAVVEKVGDDWKVAAVHMSGNVLDNAVLDAVKAGSVLKTVGFPVIGVIAGLVLGAVIFRRKA